MPSVSIIMPVYNARRYIQAAIESVLQQSYKDFELIVVDDGSSDETEEIVNRMVKKHPTNILFIKHEENKGAAAARNTAIKHSKSSILMFADADDIQHPLRLESTMKFMFEQSVDMVFNDCELVNESGQSLGRNKGYPLDLTNDNALLFSLKRNHFWTSLVLIRKNDDLVLDESLPNAEDFELFLRLIRKGYTFGILRQELTKYRVHDSNISSNGEIANQSVKKILSRLDLSLLYKELSIRHGEVEASIAVAAAHLWLDEIEKCIELLDGRPFSLEGSFVLAVSYYKAGKLTESLIVFFEINKKIQNAAVLNNIGVLTYLIYGEKYEAEAWFNNALEIQENYQDAAKNLSNLKRGNFHLKITERPLRSQIIHTHNYKLE